MHLNVVNVIEAVIQGTKELIHGLCSVVGWFVDDLPVAIAGIPVYQTAVPMLFAALWLAVPVSQTSCEKVALSHLLAGAIIIAVVVVSPVIIVGPVIIEDVVGIREDERIVGTGSAFALQVDGDIADPHCRIHCLDVSDGGIFEAAELSVAKIEAGPVVSLDDTCLDDSVDLAVVGVLDLQTDGDLGLEGLFLAGAWDLLDLSTLGFVQNVAVILSLENVEDFLGGRRSDVWDVGRAGAAVGGLRKISHDGEGYVVGEEAPDR
mmetsp:Transcript_8305/g.22501  ORF Transcript_8305/g.22501 Transcript_8305/m.22501 type:complete len:263 (-) Transcript_8305:45-833(-)